MVSSVRSGKMGVPGRLNLQLAVDLDDRLFGGPGHLRLVVVLAIAIHGKSIMGRVSAANDFALHGLDALRCRNFKVDRLAFVEREQQRLRDRIGAVILLEHLQGVFAGRVAQDHRVGLEMHGDVVHVDLVLAGLQIEREFLADDGEILVVNRERWL